MAYLFLSFPMTLDDLKGHSRDAGHQDSGHQGHLTNICATFSKVLTDTARRAVPRR